MKRYLILSQEGSLYHRWCFKWRHNGFPIQNQSFLYLQTFRCWI